MFYSLFKKYRGDGFNNGLKMYDICTIAYILNPELFIVEKAYVEIDTQKEISVGTMYVDFKGYLRKEPNVKIMTDINSKKFIS
ncbi:nucleoside hydrolase [Spiroplasma floricola]|uniref:Non-specific riboncleoside hydrolase n=1 Tax=Spiroplasma floricola 23-6 TaxID=1336749 RepID=A0A2K8SGB0_9MOLU|nr:nucleoside hydrolase [Spiroplasma floricola]AUB31850.1 non-specific riboncleoside hydrolase [Spiroplasma floricola 23-6]